MWIIVAVIVVFLFARALNNAGKRGSDDNWPEEEEQAFRMKCLMNDIDFNEIAFRLEVESNVTELGRCVQCMKVDCR